ncbi:hypothetical protein ACW9UR_10590 [Halovulum sp. GXIMD14794]
MKLDERFMTIMTAMFLIVGVGAVIQRDEDGSSLFGGGGTYEPRPDNFTLRAGRSQALDVLLNDRNPDRVDPAELTLVQPPNCGTATVLDGAIQYSSPPNCDGSIALSYCVPFDGACEVVSVTLRVISQQGTSQSVATAPDPAAQVEQGGAPAQDQLAMRQPMRLTLPSESEVITPSEATAEVRRMGGEPAQAVVQEADASHESNVNVSRTSARTGSVSVVGTEMAAPSPVGESSGIALASNGATDSSPRRSMAPMGLAEAPRTGLSPAPAFEPPSRPDAANPQVMASIPSMPSVSVDSPSAGLATAPTPAETAEAPEVDTAEVDTAEVETAEAEAVEAEAGPVVATDIGSAPTVEADTALAGLPNAGDQSATPADDAPAVSMEVAGLAAPATDNSAPAPAGPALAEAPAVENAAPAPAPVETEVAAATPAEPEAQTAQPEQAEAPEPEERSLIASLARSNTVLGATVSAAKALFGPEETSAPREVIATASAPRPEEVTEVASLDLDTIEIEEALGTLPVTIDSRPEPIGKPVEIAALETGDAEPYRRRTEQALTPLQLMLSGEKEGATVIGEDGTEVAALSPDGADLRPRLRDGVTAPAANGLPAPETGTEETEVAALPLAGDDPELDLPWLTPGLVTGVSCEIDLSMQVQVGAELVVSLSSPCRPGKTFAVDHAGLVFTADTDADGVATFIVPAMQTNAIVRVTFPDGGTAVDRVTVEGMSRMTRVAVIWSDELDFDLHAREFGAEAGSGSDIWEGNPRDYRTARRSGGGYLQLLGPFKGPGARAEVYTIFETLRTDSGKIDFSLELSAYSDACTKQPVVRVLRSEQAHIVDQADMAIDTRACDGDSVAGAEFGLTEIEIADAY